MKRYIILAVCLLVVGLAVASEKYYNEELLNSKQFTFRENHRASNY